MSLVNAFGALALDASVQEVKAAVQAVEADVEALNQAVANLHATQQSSLTQLQAIKSVLDSILTELQAQP